MCGPPLEFKKDLAESKTTIHLVFFWIAFHGRVPAAYSNSLDGRPVRWRCLMPCGLHSAISGIVAGGILGLGTADRLLVFAPPPRSCCVVWFVSLLSGRSNSFPNSSAHKLPFLL